MFEFVNAMTANKSLLDVNLSYNRIGDDGGNALHEMFKENFTLTSVLLYGNGICHHVLYGQIDVMCLRNQKLQWKYAREHLFNVVLGLEGICSNTYVLLWIFDSLESHNTHVNQFKKVQLIVSIIESVRKVRAARGPPQEFTAK